MGLDTAGVGRLQESAAADGVHPCQHIPAAECECHCCEPVQNRTKTATYFEVLVWGAMAAASFEDCDEEQQSSSREGECPTKGDEHQSVQE